MEVPVYLLAMLFGDLWVDLLFGELRQFLFIVPFLKIYN